MGCNSENNVNFSKQIVQTLWREVFTLLIIYLGTYVLYRQPMKLQIKRHRQMLYYAVNSGNPFPHMFKHNNNNSNYNDRSIWRCPLI
ncbi:UNVERIFIED_CONTAM: hypothetical protein NCL1_29997 [Trichonephila clavipes]